ncbi:MAG TPA: DNA polymerase Y family protein [Thermohalobaculum sp.]|nr:DNA polymerase Y family protein [Thermohalobaculum sp.]
MSRRIIAAALPHLAAENALRHEGRSGLERPFAVVERVGGALRLASVNPAAAAAGLAPDLGLADASALCPGLLTRPAAPGRLAGFRRALVRWAGRFSPLVATEGDALILDATGCAHLFGGEAAMLEALLAGLADLGLTGRAAMADTRGAAWALAHFGPAPLVIAPQGRSRAAIGPLGVAALRLDREAAEGLAALGLVAVEDAARIPRGALARRFGLATLRRLDQALGAEPEPVAPEPPAPAFAARLTLPEPVGQVEDVMAGLERLLARLCRTLETRQAGARRLRLTVRRVDGADAGAAITLARPLRDPARLAALLAPKVAQIDAGHGIDALRLEATEVEPLCPAQVRRGGEGNGAGGSEGDDGLADLLSRLGNRIGFESLIRLIPAESHIPERAFSQAAALWSAPEPFPAVGPPRPLTLFPPEPVTPAPVTLGAGPARPAALPPARFRWRRRRLTLVRAQGPERLAPEWWWHDPAWISGLRDYWCVETQEGPRLWLFRTPEAPRPLWFAHGAFA